MKLFALTLLLLVVVLSANAGEIEKSFLKSNLKSDLQITEHFPSSFMFLGQFDDYDAPAFIFMMDGDNGRLAVTPIDKDDGLREVIYDFYNDKYYYHYLDENCCEVYHHHFGIYNLTQFLDKAWQNKSLLVDEPLRKVYEVFFGDGLVSFEVTYTNYVLTEIYTKDLYPFDDFGSGLLSNIIPHEIMSYQYFIPSACYSPEDECDVDNYSNLFFKR